MNKKNTILYFLICISGGYLLYNYMFSDYRYGMMRHHYGYYDGYSENSFYLSSFFVLIAFLVIIFCILLLLSNKTKSNNTAIEILNKRLSIGEISIEEYKSIKAILTRNNE